MLLLTLGIIGLAAIALAGFARQSLRLALDANIADSEAQRRWGEISCRRVLLDRAEQILEAQAATGQKEQTQLPMPAALEADFMLGGQRFRVLLADENAKLNLNAVLDRKPGEVEQVARALTDDRTLQTPKLALHPSPAGKDTRARFESWGQVYDFLSSDTSFPLSESIAASTREVTCWGDGQLNVRRASELALRTAARLVLNAQEVSELLKLRAKWQGTSLDGLLRQLDLRDSKLSALRRLLGDRSTCHSLWVHAATPQRQWATLYIAGGPTRGGSPIQTFTW